MINKNKNNQHQNIESIASTAAEHLGMFVVGVAAVINVAGLAHHEERHTTGVLQPAYATTSSHESETTTGGSELRRPGREEIRHSSSSFGAFQRSPNTAGTV